MDVAVLIPAYKPSEELLKTLEALSSNNFALYVVDDGSGEEFGDIFSRAAKYASVITQTPNQGKGAALKNGISHIDKEAPEIKYIVTADADGQHKPEDIIRISDYLHENGGFVIGARKFEGEVPFRSRYGNAITRGVFAVISGTHVSDTQTGLRGFDRPLFGLMTSIEGNRYEYEMNVLLKTARKKIPINEIPISTVYENDNSSSHFNPLLDSLRIYREIFKYSLSSLFAFGIDFVMLMVFNAILPESKYITTLSVVFARCISSPINYAVNRTFVFKSNSDKLKSFFGYFALVLAVLGAKVLLMKLTRDIIGMPLALANLLVESLLFISNFFIQKKIIFKNKTKN